MAGNTLNITCNIRCPETFFYLPVVQVRPISATPTQSSILTQISSVHGQPSLALYKIYNVFYSSAACVMHHSTVKWAVCWQVICCPLRGTIRLAHQWLELRTLSLQGLDHLCSLHNRRRSLWVGDRAIVWPEELCQWKKSSYTIGNRTRDLPVCSAVPQPLRHCVPPKL
jgi:hypothetical protein